MQGIGIDTIDDLRPLLDLYRNTRYSGGRRDIAALETDPQAFAQFLYSQLEVYDDCVKRVKELVSGITLDHLADHRLTPGIAGLGSVFARLIDQLTMVKQAIGPVTFEKAQDELAKEIAGTAGSLETLIQLALGDFSPADDSSKTLLMFTRLSLRWRPTGVGQIKHAIAKSLSLFSTV